MGKMEAEAFGDDWNMGVRGYRTIPE